MTSNLKYCVIQVFGLIKKRVWMRTKSDWKMEKQGKKRKEQNEEQIGDNNRGGMQEKKKKNKKRETKRNKEEEWKSGWDQCRVKVTRLPARGPASPP